MGKRKNYRFIVKREYGNITSVGHAVCMQVAAKIAIRSIKTIMVGKLDEPTKTVGNTSIKNTDRGGYSPYMWRLYCDTVSAAKRQGWLTDATESNQINQDIIAFHGYASEYRQLAKTKTGQKQLAKKGKVIVPDAELKMKDSAQYAKKHTYKMVKLADGKSHKLRCKAYYTLHETYLGKADNLLWQLDTPIANSDGYDLLNQTYLYILEVANDGIITDFESLTSKNSVAQNIVYSKVNAYIRMNKRQDVGNKRYTRFYTDSVSDENKWDESKLAYLTDKQAEKVINSVDGKIARTVFYSLLFESLPKKANRTNAINAFILYTEKGWTQARIAKHLKVAQRTVSGYIDLCARWTNGTTAFQAATEIIFAS